MISRHSSSPHPLGIVLPGHQSYCFQEPGLRVSARNKKRGRVIEVHVSRLTVFLCNARAKSRVPTSVILLFRRVNTVSACDGMNSIREIHVQKWYYHIRVNCTCQILCSFIADMVIIKIQCFEDLCEIKITWEY